MAIGLNGVSLVHLTFLFDVQTQGFFVVFLCQGVGGVCGVLANAEFFGRFPAERQLAAFTYIASAACIFAPYTGDIYGYAALYAFVMTFAYGYMESGR